MKIFWFGIFTLLLVTGCTIDHFNYALVSTRDEGRFYSVTGESNRNAKRDKVNINEQGKTELDEIVKGKTTTPDFSKYALVIGIQDYKQQANVNYADNSAVTFSLAAKNILGVPEENVFFLLNNDATSGQIKTKITLLKELAEPGDSLYFFFAGHGVPGRDGNTYLLPADMGADSIHLEPQLKLDSIYTTLNGSKANKIYAFVDSCFSGKDDQGELIYKGVAPVFKRLNKQFSSNKLTVMTAGSASDFANQYQQENHRLFSYYLIRGLTQEKENINELYDYVKRNVKRASLRFGLGYKQVPMLQTVE